MKWESFEQECFDYIKSKLPSGYNAELCGGSDSTISDIAISNTSEKLFYIEVKDSPSQAGQFVVLIENGKFVFSKRNKCCIDPCLPIIDFLNKNFESFSDVEQASIPIKISKKVQYDRIISFYKNEKNVDYFITKKGGKFLVFKTEDLPQYFDISCNLRRKKCGSKNVSKPMFKLTKEIVEGYLEKYYPHVKAHFYYDGSLLKVQVPKIFDLGGTKIETIYFNLYFSKSDSDVYTLTQLSDTNNPNVIFTLTHKYQEPKALLCEINSYIMKVNKN